MCGCPVVVLDDGNWSLDKSANGPMRMVGVVDSLDKIEQAKAEVAGAHQAYMDYLPEMVRQLDEFVRVTQSL